MLSLTKYLFKWFLSMSLMSTFICTANTAIAEPKEPLTWSTSEPAKGIDLFRNHGVTNGTVAKLGGAYRNWAQNSSVSIHQQINIPGKYELKLRYNSKNAAQGKITVDGKEIPVELQATEKERTLNVGELDFSRIGVHLFKIEFSDPGVGLSRFELCHVPGKINISKPVLIAGGDYVKLEASIALDKTIPADQLELDAEISEWPKGKTLWTGPITAKQLPGGLEIVDTIKNLKPKLWSPAYPNLYNFTLNIKDKEKDTTLQSVTSRFGFRDFQTKDGKFYLNGQPIFLRGNNITPPGGGTTRNLNPNLAYSPDAIRSILQQYKDNNINLVRNDTPLWLSLCDEMGLMVFAGRYGVPGWGGAKRHHAPVYDPSALKYYKKLFADSYGNHPSHVIRVLTNEMPSAASEGGKKYIAFIKECHKGLKKWDPTRADIDNAGFGLGQGGDIYDLHTYMGWYNGSHLSYNKFRTDLRKLRKDLSSLKQPITFTECVGAYTDEQGRSAGTGKQISAGLTWTGNMMDVPEYALEYQAYLAAQSIEAVRRLRAVNPDMAGIMPFSSTGIGWEKAEKPEDIKFRPIVTKAYKTSFQPVLLSWENYHPHIYAGTTLKTIAHVVNDADDGRDLNNPVVEWQLTNAKDNSVVLSGKLPVGTKKFLFGTEIKHYAAVSKKLSIDIPKDIKPGQYLLKGSVLENGKVVSKNQTKVYIAAPQTGSIERKRAVRLYDPSGTARKVLEKAGLRLGVDFQITNNLFTSDLKGLTGAQLQETLGVTEIQEESREPSESLLIIGAKHWFETISQRHREMQKFIKDGGRVLVLYPSPDALHGLDVYKEVVVRDNKWIGDDKTVDFESIWHTSRDFGVFINPRRNDTGIFDDVTREQLRFWTGSDDWDQTKPDLPKIEPVNRLIELRNAEALENTAIIANFGRGLKYLAVAEIFKGKGSVILSGFDFDRFAGIDPVADKVLRNLIAYAADDKQHHLVPQAKEKINMGSPSDEEGIIPSEFHNGLLMEYAPGYQIRRIAGPFWYNRLCHTKLLEPENKTRKAFIHLRAPDGKKHIILKARRIPTGQNKGKYKPEKLSMTIDGKTVDTVIPDEKEVTVKIPLPNETGERFRIDFSGTDDIGIAEMSFE